MSLASNYCGVCGEFLGPEDFDGICPECEDKRCEGCGELMIVDGTDAEGDDVYRCPFCNPNAGEQVVNEALTRAYDEIGNIAEKLAQANYKLFCVPLDAIINVMANGVDARWAEWQQSDKVIKEIDAWIKTQVHP